MSLAGSEGERSALHGVVWPNRMIQNNCTEILVTGIAVPFTQKRAVSYELLMPQYDHVRLKMWRVGFDRTDEIAWVADADRSAINALQILTL